MPVSLRSADSSTSADLNPERGGAISALRHDGRNVLWTPPRHTRRLRTEAPAGLAAQSEISWMEQSVGGWEVLAPSAGRAGTVGTIHHDFHGLAGRSAWRVTVQTPSTATMSCQMPEIGFRSSRQVRMSGNGRCDVRETLAFEGTGTHPALWGSHLAFGNDFVDGPLLLEHNGTVVGGQLDGEERVPELAARLVGSPLAAPSSGLVYLDFTDTSPRVAMTNHASGMRALITWDHVVFPFAWIWVELQGTLGWPWFGRASALGVEPMSSWPALGLAGAIAAGAPVQLFRAGEPISADVSVTLHGGASPRNERRNR